MVVNVCDHQHNGIGHYSRDKVAIVTKDLGYTNKVLLLFWVFRNNDSNCRSNIKSLLGFLLQSFYSFVRITFHFSTRVNTIQINIRHSLEKTQFVFPITKNMYIAN